MKKLILILVAMLLCFGSAGADSITLDSTETLSTPTTQKIGEWYIDYISASKKRLVVRYYWEDASGVPIVLHGANRHAWQTWTCRDRQEGDNAECLDVDDPWDCCTGSGTGDCPEILDSCFTDVFSFSIRSQDVGMSIGLGLRTLIWNEMKSDVLTGGNDGTFD